MPRPAPVTRATLPSRLAVGIARTIVAEGVGKYRRRCYTILGMIVSLIWL
jgi:hypothetical protein